MISCDGDRCTLQGPVNIGNVVAVLEQGRRVLTAPHIAVDLGGLTEVDSTTVSLLLEWRREAQRGNRKIEYINLPDNLKSLAALYGVSELLGEV
ncbi:MAG: STAS domain-containing protein [Burkholderiales bacterium]|nr:STAS domain-containing protein [Burkholderiales bacterium]